MRLIDADALERFLKRLRRELPKESRDFFTRDEMILNFQQYVHMQPTIDAMPVVRCKECKYYENPRLKVFENCCRKDLLTPMKPNDYCSYGEKMESEGST